MLSEVTAQVGRWRWEVAGGIPGGGGDGLAEGLDALPQPVVRLGQLGAEGVRTRAGLGVRGGAHVRHPPHHTRGALRKSVAMDTDVWRQRIREFSQEREWGQFHDPKSLAMALSVEVAELAEIFQWLTPEESRAVMQGDRRQDVADEVADVMTYLLRLADVLDLDLEAAMASKAERNAARYPVATSRGSSAKAPGLAAGGPARPAPIEVTLPVLGVDACRAGWVGAVLEPGAPRPRVVVAPTITELVSMVRESLGIVVVGIDIPIGLPDNTIRAG